MTRLADTGLTSAAKEEALNPRQVARASWNRPHLRKLQAADAKTGVNSTTDFNATFS